MKRAFILLLSCAFLCACTPAESPPTGPALTGDENTFSLSYLPDIGEYAERPVPVRWYADYTDTLIPSEEYGTLIPYLGKVKEFEGITGVMQQMYGLCTENGVIVTDPVYTGVSYCEDGYYLLTKVSPESSGPFTLEYITYLAKTDGSWVKELWVGQTVRPAGAGIYESRDNITSTKSFYFSQDGYRLPVYDAQEVTGFEDGTVLIADESAHTAYFATLRADQISDTFYSAQPAADGHYIVSTDGELFGITDEKGEFLVPATHNTVSYNDGVYLFAGGGSVTVTDTEFNEISDLSTVLKDIHPSGIRLDGPGVVSYGSNGKRTYLCLKGEKKDWIDAEYNNGKYLIWDGKQSRILDAELNTLLTLKDRHSHLQTADESPFVYIYCNSFFIYNTATGELIEKGLSAVHTPTYTTKELLTKADTLYSADGKRIGSYDPDHQVNITDTPQGKIYTFSHEGIAYTMDEDGNEIVSIEWGRD